MNALAKILHIENNLQVLPGGKTYREKVMRLENSLKQMPGAGIGNSNICKWKHRFKNGLYYRQITIPALHTLIGEIHKEAHMVYLLKGELIVVTEDGGRQHLIAPMQFISPAGVKRSAQTLEETVWVTVHKNPDNIKNLDKLLEMITTKSYEEFDKEQAALENSVNKKMISQ